MHLTNNKTGIAVLIAANLVLWPLFIIPGLVRIIAAPTSFHPSVPAVRLEISPLPPTDTTNGIPSKIRDPFSFLVAPREKTSGDINTRTFSRTTPPQNRSGVSYVSRFRLKSVVQSRNRFTATLEEIPADSSRNNTVPYSYRFGSQPETPEAKSYLVSEGDTLQDEKVFKIGENFVILSRNNKYYKLTFAGGAPIEKP